MSIEISGLTLSKYINRSNKLLLKVLKYSLLFIGFNGAQENTNRITYPYFLGLEDIDRKVQNTIVCVKNTLKSRYDFRRR